MSSLTLSPQELDKLEPETASRKCSPYMIRTKTEASTSRSSRPLPDRSRMESMMMNSWSCCTQLTSVKRHQAMKASASISSTTSSPDSQTNDHHIYHYYHLSIYLLYKPFIDILQAKSILFYNLLQFLRKKS